MKIRRTNSPRAPALAAGLSAAVLLLLAAVGGAQGLNPRDWNRYNGWKVSSFTVSGAPPDLAADLSRGLNFAGRRRLLRGVVRPPFSSGALIEDVQRARLFLASRGYPASRVGVELTPDAEARRVAIVFAVEPGPVVIIAEVRLTGWPDKLPDPLPDESDLPAAGERFSDERAHEGAVHLASRLQDAGYAEVTIEMEVRPLANDRVVLEYVIEPGDSFVIRSVDVSGCSEDLLPLARRVLDIDPGTEYSATLLREAAQDLRATQLFRQVDITTENIGDSSLALKTSVADGRWRSLSASVGSWTDNPWMLRASWTHRNLFRGSRGLRIGGTYATHDRQAGVEVFQLGLLSPRAITTLGVLGVREDEDSYRSQEFLARLVQSFRPRGRGLWQLGVSISNVDVTTYNPDFEELPESQDWLLETYVDRKWDWTDDFLYPTRGGFVKVSLTYAPAAAFFGASYTLIQVDGSGYRSLVGGILGAARLRGGWAQPLGDNPDLLANRRFYAGGYNTMRGFTRRRLGPRDAEGNPRGGQATVLGGVELRRHLVSIFDAAVFLDSGNVWQTPSEVSAGSIRAAVGVGFDLRTPLGPLRVGYAWNLGSDLPDDPMELWHFGIGYPW